MDKQGFFQLFSFVLLAQGVLHALLHLARSFNIFVSMSKSNDQLGLLSDISRKIRKFLNRPI